MIVKLTPRGILQYNTHGWLMVLVLLVATATATATAKATATATATTPKEEFSDWP